MNYEDIEITTDGGCTTATIGRICNHNNGWYGTVPFWMFEKRIFACSDCGKILHGKSLQKFRERKAN